MPYELYKKDGKHCVRRSDTKEDKGCSDSLEKAKKHMAALYAAENSKEYSVESEFCGDMPKSPTSFNMDFLAGLAHHLKVAYQETANEHVLEGLIMLKGKLLEKEAEEHEHQQGYDDYRGDDGHDLYAIDQLVASGAEEFAWEGPIVFEGVKTGDNRIFKAGAIQWDEASLPWPFRWQRSSIKGHEGAVPIGRVDRLERREDGAIYGYGVIIPSLNEEAAEYLRLIQAGVASGVSVDGDSAEFDVQEMDGGAQQMVFSSMRLRSLTAVDIPAFNEARVGLTDDEELDGETLSVETDDQQFAVSDWEIVNWGGATPFCVKPKALGNVGEGTPDSPELKAPLKCFKTEEEAKAFIESTSENAEKVAKKVEPGPAEIAKAEAKAEASDEGVEVLDSEDEDSEFAKKKRKKKMKIGNNVHRWTYDVISAAAIPVLPSTEWFQDPELEGPTGITITPEGAVYGHLALFNTCHIGFQGSCVKPPKGSDYKYFHTGEIETAEGELVEVGHLTFNTGHASMHASPVDAASHYDNTGTVAADVRVGEDEFGIWVAGGLRPHLTDTDIRSFRAAPLSGDWRRIAGKMELVGALAVNVPGFPVPRARALVASGETETLFTFTEDLMDENIRAKYKAELAKRAFSVTEFHLPGEHDQSDHAGSGSGWGGKDLPTDIADFVGPMGGFRLRRAAKAGLKKMPNSELKKLDKNVTVVKNNAKYLVGLGGVLAAAGAASAAGLGGAAALGAASPAIGLVAAGIIIHKYSNSAAKNVGYEKRVRGGSFDTSKSGIRAETEDLTTLDLGDFTYDFAINLDAVSDDLTWDQALTLAKKAIAGVTPKKATPEDIDKIQKGIDAIKASFDLDEDKDVKAAIEKAEASLGSLGKGEVSKAPASKKMVIPTPKAKTSVAPTAYDGETENLVDGEDFASKTEDGKAFPASDYAYVPDAEKPSTWKLRLTSTPGGDPDPGIVGAAAAALGKGFRGNKVEIPAEDRAKVVAKVRAAWKKANPDKKPDEMPDVLKEG